MPTRWDGDKRGYGVGDAAWLVAGATELVSAFSQSAWVAEEPEIHLGPHVQRWSQLDQRVGLLGSHTDESNAYILELEWRGPPGRVGEARAAVFSLIGSFAETATYVRQRRVREHGDGVTMKLRFEVGTGELAPDTRFASHGHVVIINLTGAC